MSEMRLNHLPLQEQCLIFSYLETPDLFASMQSCRAIYRLLSESKESSIVWASVWPWCITQADSTTLPGDDAPSIGADEDENGGGWHGKLDYHSFRRFRNCEVELLRRLRLSIGSGGELQGVVGLIRECVGGLSVCSKFSLDLKQHEETNKDKDMLNLDEIDKARPSEHEATKIRIKRAMLPRNASMIALLGLPRDMPAAHKRFHSYVLVSFINLLSTLIQLLDTETEISIDIDGAPVSVNSGEDRARALSEYTSHLHENMLLERVALLRKLHHLCVRGFSEPWLNIADRELGSYQADAEEIQRRMKTHYFTLFLPPATGATRGRTAYSERGLVTARLILLRALTYCKSVQITRRLAVVLQTDASKDAGKASLVREMRLEDPPLMEGFHAIGQIKLDYQRDLVNKTLAACAVSVWRDLLPDEFPDTRGDKHDNGDFDAYLQSHFETSRAPRKAAMATATSSAITAYRVQYRRGMAFHPDSHSSSHTELSTCTCALLATALQRPPRIASTPRNAQERQRRQKHTGRTLRELLRRRVGGMNPQEVLEAVVRVLYCDERLLDGRQSIFRHALVQASDETSAGCEGRTCLGLTKPDSSNYYESSNSFLDDVLRSKVGIPISLSALICIVSFECGLTLFSKEDNIRPQPDIGENCQPQWLQPSGPLVASASQVFMCGMPSHVIVGFRCDSALTGPLDPTRGLNDCVRYIDPFHPHPFVPATQAMRALLQHRHHLHHPHLFVTIMYLVCPRFSEDRVDIAPSQHSDWRRLPALKKKNLRATSTVAECNANLLLAHLMYDLIDESVPKKATNDATSMATHRFMRIEKVMRAASRLGLVACVEDCIVRYMTSSYRLSLSTPEELTLQSPVEKEDEGEDEDYMLSEFERWRLMMYYYQAKDTSLKSTIV